jgi:all-trans-8'-apo-beta-carotenal 15,15'-oxygenase
MHLETSPIAAQPRTPQATPWLRSFENLRFEHGFRDLSIEGHLPRDLAGTFYWNGSARYSAFGQNYAHWLDGEGAVGAVRIQGGGAKGAVKFVKTPSLMAEERSKKLLYSRVIRTSPRPFAEILRGERRNPANTSVWWHRDKLYALCPNGLPVQLDPRDLETLSECDFSGLVFPGFSPHATYCAERRAFYNFGVAFGRKTMLDLVEFPDGGGDRKLVSIELKRPVFLHDFKVTQRHAIVLVHPVVIKPLKMLLNLKPLVDCVEYRPELGTEVLLIPLDAPEQYIRFDTDAFCAFHFANAFEDGNEIVLDGAANEDFRPMWEYISGLAQGRLGRPGNQMRRFRISPAKRSLNSRLLGEFQCDLPRISPDVENRDYQFVYAHALPDRPSGPSEYLRKLDIRSGKSEAIEFGSRRYPSEGVFVPRAMSEAEDDGYLLTLVYDADRHASFLAVMDARRPGQEPLARLHFEQHVPPHFHGTWVQTAAS